MQQKKASTLVTDKCLHDDEYRTNKSKVHFMDKFYTQFPSSMSVEI